MITPLSYCYLPDDYEGHRPANREEVHRAGRGAVYSWPSTTTIHMDLMRRTRATVEQATDDALADEAAHLEEEFVPPAPEHRSGCPVQRTGKCLCTYLAQWDRDLVSNGMPPVALEASKERLADFTQQMSDEGRVITIDTLHGRTSEWDGAFKDPAKLGPGVLVIPDEMWDDFDHSKLKLSGSPEFISASEYQARQQEQGPTPFQSHLADVEENPMPVEPRLQLPIVIATTAEDPAVIAEKIIKDNPRWFGELPAGTYQKREEDTAAQDLSDEKLRTKYWHKEYTDLNRRFTGVLVLALAGWALSVARGIWGF